MFGQGPVSVRRPNTELLKSLLTAADNRASLFNLLVSVAEKLHYFDFA